MAQLFKIMMATLIMHLSINCYGQLLGPTTDRKGTGQEFFVGKDLGKPLITVNLISGVSKPGVYHIPIGTSLPELISYSGGVTKTSDIEDISIRRWGPNMASEFVQVNLDDLMHSNEKLPHLKNKDVIYIKERHLESTIKWATLASGIASAVLSLFLIRETFDDDD